MRRLLYPTSSERRRIRVIFSALLPAGADPALPYGADSVPMDAFLNELFERAPLRVTLGLRACSWLLWLSPLWATGRLRTFGALAPREREGVLETLRTSSLYLVRELPLLFKMIASLAVFGLPEVQAALEVSPRDEHAPLWLERPRQD